MTPEELAELHVAMATGDADREYFDRHGRRHRIRRAAEFELAHRARQDRLPASAGLMWFTVKRRPANGGLATLGVTFLAPDVIPADVSEEAASAVFDMATVMGGSIATGPMMRLMVGSAEVGLQ